MEPTQDEILQRLNADPGDPLFAQVADSLRRAGKWSDALDIALSGLTANPQCHRGRLILARLFYDRHYYPFAVRELEHLHRAVPENASIGRLLERLSPGSTTGEAGVSAIPTAQHSSEMPSSALHAPHGDEVVAEEDFDIDILAEAVKERK